MGRQMAALLSVLALTLAASYFFNIGMTAKERVEFAVADIVAYESGFLFALLGGAISRKYGFALAVGALYLCLCGMAVYFLNALVGDGGLPYLLRENALNIAASVLTGMAGACVGVFLRNRRRAAARP